MPLQPPVVDDRLAPVVKDEFFHPAPWQVVAKALDSLASHAGGLLLASGIEADGRRGRR